MMNLDFSVNLICGFIYIGIFIPEGEGEPILQNVVYVDVQGYFLFPF